MKELLFRFIKNDSGAQMAEYSLLLVLIGMIVAGAALWLSGQIQDAYQKIGECIVDAKDGSIDTSACPTFTPGD